MSVDMTVPDSILRSYLANRQLMQQAQEIQNQHENALATHAEHEKQLNEEHNQFQELLKFRKMQAGMELRNALAEHLSNLHSLSQPLPGSPGVNVGPQGASLQGPQDLTGQLGEFGQYLPDFLKTYTPGEELGPSIRAAQNISTLAPAQAQAKALETTAVGQASAPFVTAKANFEKELKQMDIDEEDKKSLRDAQNRLAITQLEVGSRERMSDLERQTQLRMNAADVNARIYGINQEYGFDPSSQMGKTMIYNAATDPAFAKKIASSTSPRDMKVATAVSASGLRPVDDLPIDQLKGLDTLEGSLGVMDKIINQASTTHAGAFVQHLKAGASWLSPEIGNDLDQLKSVVSTTARSLEGGNARLLATQLQNASASLGDIRQAPKTQKELQDLKQNLMDLSSRARSTILAPYSPEQRKMIIDRNGLLPDIPQGAPDWLQKSPRMNIKGHRLDPDKSMQAGQPVYVGE